MTKQKVLERDVQKAILEYLSLKRIFAWRNNSGRMPYESKGKSYMIQMGPVGSCDIIGCLPDGRFLGIEVKGSEGVLSSAQIDFIAKINNSGGVAFCARSIDDVVSALKNAGSKSF